MEQNDKSNKRTQVSEIGKAALTLKLLEMTDNSLSSANIYGESDTGFVWNNSHDILLEGIDFDLVYMPLKYLGYKSVIINLGNHYARFFTPDNISIRVGLSGRFSVEDITELWTGMVAAIKEHGIKKVSLTLDPSLTGLTLSLSSQGKQRMSDFVQKPKPMAGDLICLSGNIGSAYMGLQILEREKRLFNTTSTQPDLEKYKFVLKNYLNPEINTSIFKEIEATKIAPSNGAFIFTGLADSINLLCHETKLGARIFLERIPISSQTDEVAIELNMDPVTAALNGGGDVQFIFTFPVAEYDKLIKELPQLDIIGHLSSPSEGAMLVTPDGSALDLKAQAWSKSVP